MEQKNKSLNDIDSIGINLNRNLTQLMNDNGVSLTVLHRNTGIAIPTIKRLQSDPSANPTMATLIPLASFFGVTANQLVGPNLINIQLGYIENKLSWLNVPIIKWEDVPNWMSENNLSAGTSNILVDIDVGDKPYALIVESDDWETISKGSILIINTELNAENKDFIIVLKSGQTKPVLCQLWISDNTKYLKPLAHYIPPIVMDETYQVLGVLMQIRKNIRE